MFFPKQVKRPCGGIPLLRKKHKPEAARDWTSHLHMHQRFRVNKHRPEAELRAEAAQLQAKEEERRREREKERQQEEEQARRHQAAAGKRKAMDEGEESNKEARGTKRVKVEEEQEREYKKEEEQVPGPADSASGVVDLLMKPFRVLEEPEQRVTTLEQGGNGHPAGPSQQAGTAQEQSVEVPVEQIPKPEQEEEAVLMPLDGKFGSSGDNKDKFSAPVSDEEEYKQGVQGEQPLKDNSQEQGKDLEDINEDRPRIVRFNETVASKSNPNEVYKEKEPRPADYWGPTLSIRKTLLSKLCKTVLGEHMEYLYKEQGSQHAVYVMGDGSFGPKVVIKVPAAGWEDRWTEERQILLDSEVHTMKYLAANTQIPVPKIFAYDKNLLESPIGAPFIMMAFVGGYRACEWSGTSGSWRHWLHHKNHPGWTGHLKFSKAVLVEKNGKSKWKDCTVYSRRSGEEVTEAMAKISRHLCQIRSTQNDIFCSDDDGGIGKRPYIEISVSRDEAGVLQERAEEKNVSSIEEMRQQLVREESIECSDVNKGVNRVVRLAFEAAKSRFKPSDDGDFALIHPDLGKSKVFMDLDGKVTGVIGWYNARFVPLWAGPASFPPFLTDSLNVAEEKPRNQKQRRAWLEGIRDPSTAECTLYAFNSVNYTELYSAIRAEPGRQERRSYAESLLIKHSPILGVGPLEVLNAMLVSLGQYSQRVPGGWTLDTMLYKWLKKEMELTRYPPPDPDSDSDASSTSPKGKKRQTVAMKCPKTSK